MKTNNTPNVSDLARWIDLQLSTIIEGVSAGYTLGNYNSVWIDKGATVFNVSLSNGETVEIDSDNYSTAEDIANAIISTLDNTPATMNAKETIANTPANLAKLHTLAVNGAPMFYIWLDAVDDAATTSVYLTEDAACADIARLESDDKEAGIYEPGAYRIINAAPLFRMKQTLKATADGIGTLAAGALLAILIYFGLWAGYAAGLPM